MQSDERDMVSCDACHRDYHPQAHKTTEFYLEVQPEQKKHTICDDCLREFDGMIEPRTGDGLTIAQWMTLEAFIFVHEDFTETDQRKELEALKRSATTQGVGIKLNLLPEALEQITTELGKGSRFFVIAPSGTQVWKRNRKQKLVTYSKNYNSALLTFDGWRSEGPTLFYWNGLENTEDSLVIIDGPDSSVRLLYLVGQLNLMSRGIIPSNQQQREEVALQIGKATPCGECGKVGYHPTTCSKRELTAEEKLKQRVACLEGALRGIATRFEEFHDKCELDEKTDTGEAWDLIRDLHRAVINSLGPNPANVAPVDRKLS